MPRKVIASGLCLAFLVLSSQTVEDLGLSLEQLENKLLFLVNQERSGLGLPELRLDPLLRTLARTHSQKTIQENRLAHDFPGYEPLGKRAALAGLYFSKIGENVASGDTFIMRFFHERLLASHGHRENILDKDFTHLGIGIEQSGTRYYVTQEFASLYQPPAPMAMEAELESRLKIHFGSHIVLPPAAAAEVQEFCRHISQLFLHDQSPVKISNSFGAASILNFNFTDSGTVFNRIIAEAKISNPLYWSLAVTFERSTKNLGGIYALTLILFPDLRDTLAAADGLDAFILESLNHIRKNNDLLSMALVPKLAKPAAEITRLFYQSQGSFDAIKNKDRYKLILAYQTSSLSIVPDDIAQQIVACPQIRSTGIHVFYPLAEGLPGNYFIVAILGI